MFCRVRAAVAAAAIATMLLVPAQSDARGGAAAGHGGGFHPPVRPIHPPVRPTHPVHPPFVHRHDPLFVHRKFRERHAFEHRHDRRTFVGFGGYGYGGYGNGNGYGDNGNGDDGYGDNGYGGNGYCNSGYGYGYRRTCGDYSAFYGRYYDPSDMTGSIWMPPYTVPRASVMPIAEQLDPPIARGGCRLETVPMPSPGEAERSVTITRC
jgi:hypothetical protein